MILIKHIHLGKSIRFKNSTESIKKIRVVCDKLISSLNTLPRTLKQSNKESYFDSLVKSHSMIYFCLSEITYILEKNHNELLSSSLWKIFKVYNIIFEKNNFFFQNSIKHLYEFNSQMISKQLDNNLVAQKGLLKKSEETKKIEKDVQDNPNFVNNVLEINEQKRILRKNAAKQFSHARLQGERLDFTDDNLKDIEEKIQTERFEEEVNRCILALENGKKSIIDMTYDPFVIAEVHKIMFDKMIQESYRYSKKLKDTLVSLPNQFEDTGEVVKALDQIVFDLKNGPQPEDGLDYIPKKVYKDEYINDIIEIVKEGILDSIDDKNRKLVERTLKIISRRKKLNQREASSQTIFSNADLEKTINEEVERRISDQKNKFLRQINSMSEEINKVKKDLKNKIKENQILSKQSANQIEELKKLNGTFSQLQTKGNISNFKIEEKDKAIISLQNQIFKKDQEKKSLAAKGKVLRGLGNHIMGLYSKVIQKASKSILDESQSEDLKTYNILHKELSNLDGMIEEICGDLSISKSKIEEKKLSNIREKFDGNILDSINLKNKENDEKAVSESNEKENNLNSLSMEKPKDKIKIAASRRSSMINPLNSGSILIKTKTLGKSKRLSSLYNNSNKNLDGPFGKRRNTTNIKSKNNQYEINNKNYINSIK